MKELDKLRVLIPHWIEHNSGHGREFSHWAKRISSGGQEEIAVLLKQAVDALHAADAALKEALHKAGGPLEGHGHHHHHHNLPE